MQCDVQPYVAASEAPGASPVTPMRSAFLLTLWPTQSAGPPRPLRRRRGQVVQRHGKNRQNRLAVAHGIDNSNVDTVLVPEAQREEIESCRDADGRIRIGLERSFRLLHALGDPLGAAYLERSKELSQVLQRRNQSLLAHGFRPVDAADFQKMLDIALSFLCIESGQLPAFPRMDWKGLVL